MGQSFELVFGGLEEIKCPIRWFSVNASKIIRVFDINSGQAAVLEIRLLEFMMLFYPHTVCPRIDTEIGIIYIQIIFKYEFYLLQSNLYHSFSFKKFRIISFFLTNKLFFVIQTRQNVIKKE